ncbi:MAG TPA: TIGR02453 family protein [Thermoanaerobaculia bacterium]
MRYFTPESFAFLRELRENNNREWFAENKQRYEREVRDPALRFISDFGPHLSRIAPRLVADPRRSMFRIYRDTRFSRDKSPYKAHAGIHFFHEKAKAAASVPGFYLHVAPGESFAAAGIWHPDAGSLAKIRAAIAAKSPEWLRIKKSKLPIEGGSLKRPPRGYAPGHPLIDDLKRTDFVTSMLLKDDDLCDPKFLTRFAGACRKMSPLVEFVAKSLRLAW